MAEILLLLPEDVVVRDYYSNQFGNIKTELNEIVYLIWDYYDYIDKYRMISVGTGSMAPVESIARSYLSSVR